MGGPFVMVTRRVANIHAVAVVVPGALPPHLAVFLDGFTILDKPPLVDLERWFIFSTIFIPRH